MSYDLQFSWELSGNGWATCRVADGTAEHQDQVSYCTDALADLLYGVAGLYGPHPVQRFSFDLEPAEARWVLRRGEAVTNVDVESDVEVEVEVEVAVYRFPDMSASFDAPDQAGTLTWTSTQPRTHLAHTVLDAAQSVLRHHGEPGYLTRWVWHPFPVAALQDLRRLHLTHDTCAHEHTHDETTP